MANASLLLLCILACSAPQAAPAPGFKIAATLAEAPGPQLVCEGTAEVPDGIVLNLELFIDGRGDALARQVVRVKDGKFRMPFDVFRGAERNLPGHYRVRISYHAAFQPKPLPDVDAFHVFVPLKIGTADEIVAAQRTVRERLLRDLKEFAVIADDVQAAFEAAKGKIDPADWRTRTEGWKARCLAIEKRAAKDPDYAALNYSHLTQSGTETLRNMLRQIVEVGGAGRAADLQVGRQRLDAMLRAMILETAPAGSTAAERRTLVGQARGALVSALDTQGGAALAACRRGFSEALLKLNLKAPPEARDALLEISGLGSAYFDVVEASRERAQKLQPDLDKRLADVLQVLVTPE